MRALNPTLRLGTAALIASAIALTTSGCFANPIEQITNDVVEQAIEDAGGGQVDVDVQGGALPDGWPSLPVPEGEITSSVAVDGGYFLAVTSPEGSGDSLAAQLLSQGFTQTLSSESEGTSLVIVQNELWAVTLTWSRDPAGGGELLTYTVVPV